MNERPARPRARTRGFTLLELMVALTVGGMAISVMYTIGASLIKQYHQQQQSSSALTSLRVAVSQVKRDIARAGYMATPNLVPYAPFVTLGCGAASPVNGSLLAGIASWGNDVCNGTACNANPGNTTANNGNGFTVDDLVMYGNYETSSEYPSIELVSPTTISIGRTSHAYQTDFTRWFAGDITAPDTDALMRAFAPGRMIRIRTTTGRHHFAILAANGVQAQNGGTDAQLTFTLPIPDACTASTNGGWVAPVSGIRYFVRDDPNPPNPNPFGPMAQLVRQEISPGAANTTTALTLTEPTNNAFTYNNTRVVLDYVVSFNLGFVMTAANGPDAPDTYTPGNDTATVANVAAAPELIRAVTVELSARSPEQDSRMPFANCAGLRCYQVFTDRPGAARVRTLRAEIFVPNIANEGY